MEQEENKLYMNGQEIELKNPGTKGLADFLKITKIISRVPKEVRKNEPNKIIEYFDDEAIDAMVRLLNLTLIKTFPNMPEEERDAWGMKNAMIIFPHILKMCIPKHISDDQERASKLLERLDGTKPA